MRRSPLTADPVRTHIARLLGQALRGGGAGLGPAAFAVAVLLVSAAYGLFAQQEVHPAFEVASIKRTPDAVSKAPHPAMGGGIQPGGRMHMGNLSLVLLIQFAYAARDSAHSLPLLASQVVAPAGWMHTEPYDIEAKPPRNTDPKRSWLMLQTLLADRFKLDAPPGDQRTPGLPSRGGKRRSQVAPREERRLRLVSTRHATASGPGKSGLRLCLGPLCRHGRRGRCT